MKRKDKKIIRNLAREHYNEGKSMQETFDLISAKVKKPINEIADVIRFYPSPSLYEKHKKKIFLLFYSIMATELLILIAAIVFSFLAPLNSHNDAEEFLFGGYSIFFHKGYNYIYAGIIFGVMEDGVNQLGLLFQFIVIVLTILPIVVYLLSILHIIKGHLEKKFENITMIIPYYWYSFFFYLMVNGFNLFLGIVDSTYDNYLFISIAISLLILLIINFFILRLAIKVRNKVTPKYKKVRVAIPGTSSKRKTRLGIVFNEESPSN